MLTDINEVVEVVAVFKSNKALPSIMRWGGKIYKFKKINLVHQIQAGDILCHCFSVSDETNFFKLIFNTKNLQWILEQVYTEG